MDLSDVAENVSDGMVAGLPYSTDWSPVAMPVVTSRPVVRSIIAVSQPRGSQIDYLAAVFVGPFDVNDFRCLRLPGRFLFCPFERDPVTFQAFPMQALPLISNGIVVGCVHIRFGIGVGYFDFRNPGWCDFG